MPPLLTSSNTTNRVTTTLAILNGPSGIALPPEPAIALRAVGTKSDGKPRAAAMRAVPVSQVTNTHDFVLL